MSHFGHENMTKLHILKKKNFKVKRKTRGRRRKEKKENEEEEEKEAKRSTVISL